MMTQERNKNMDIRGIWKVKEIRVPTPEGEMVITPDNPPDDERFEGSIEMMQYQTEFAEDGVVNTLMLVPDNMREEAAKHGVTVRDDGYSVIESTVWKEENGKFYYDTGIEGEVLGEKVDSFAEIPVTDDNCLLYGLGMIVLERI
jgi:hypothetical protein